ncbi:MAG: DUF3780 domain-containing protein [Synergistaceae bacterium]|nr:DUF3780 domain-containing protein [Synergistaceae bacterium]
MTKQTYGFGVEPAQRVNHFFVLIRLKAPDEAALPPVQIFERYAWMEGGEQVPSDADVLRLEISRHKWGKVKAALTAEFNARLKKEGLKTAKFAASGGTPVERLFGKELMVLLWAIEDSDPSMISTAVRNWKGLMPEERWWLYTMTNAATGGRTDRKGWRKALRYALCENPVVERHQMSLFDLKEFEE